MKCYYEVMGLSRDCTTEDIKKQYKKLALQWHPDRNYGQEELATQTFKEISTAYTVLSDANERKWYDDHRNAILKGKNVGESNEDGENGEDEESYANELNIWHYFNPHCYDGPEDFYTVYDEIFTKIREKELESFPASSKERQRVVQQYPLFGNGTTTSDNDVLNFYQCWDNFISTLSFGYADKYNPNEAPNRQVKRAMEKENQKFRDDARKEYITLVKSLVSYVKKRDQRYSSIVLKRKQAKEEELMKQHQQKQLAKEKRKELREQWKAEQEKFEEERAEERKGAFLLADNDSEEENTSNNEEQEDEDGEEGSRMASASKGSSKKSRRGRKNNSRTIRMVNDFSDSYTNDIGRDESTITTGDTGISQDDLRLFQQISKLNLKSELSQNEAELPLPPPPSSSTNNEQQIPEDGKTMPQAEDPIREAASEKVSEEEEEEEVVELFSCEVCNKHFKTDAQLSQHLSSKVHRNKLKEVSKASKKK